MIDSTVITYADPKTSDTISEMKDVQSKMYLPIWKGFFNNRLFKRFNIYGKEKASNSFICSRLPSLNHLFTSY